MGSPGDAITCSTYCAAQADLCGDLHPAPDARAGPRSSGQRCCAGSHKGQHMFLPAAPCAALAVAAA